MGFWTVIFGIYGGGDASDAYGLLCLTVTPAPVRSVAIVPTSVRSVTISAAPVRSVTISIEVCNGH